MKHRHQLAGLGNDELLAALSTLVKHDQALTADLLVHLAEIDERQLFAELGFPSLFAYCTEVLGFCESTAGRRIAAARVCRAYPEVLGGVAEGEWSLSVLCALKPHLNQENAGELFAASRRKSIRQVEELLAARFPKADVRDLIRRLPSRPVLEVTPGAGCAANAAPAQVLAIPVGPTRSTARQAPEPLSVDRFGLHFTADSAFLALLEQVRALASYRQAGADLMSLMQAGLEAYRRELEKERFALGRKPRAMREAAGLVKSRGKERHVPAAVAREVYLRDGRQCTFVAEDGRRCGASRFLELDHIDPAAVGGEPTAVNLRLRCRTHNQLHARNYFGTKKVRTAIAHSRRQRAPQHATRSASSSLNSA